MRKNLTEIVFILDRSGSMSGLERDTIGGFNSMIEQQKKAEGEALISTVLFDNVSEVLHDRVNVKDIRPMTDRDYTVRGCTALLDAIVISSQKEAAAFIKMLNDDIVRSELTGKEYDSSSKMLLGPVGASH